MTTKTILSARSTKRLEGVHKDLIKVVYSASLITSVPFIVLEGIRTLERQQDLYRKGATRTLRSRHLSGHAVDLGAWLNNTVRWDWPLYYKIADAMKAAAEALNVRLEWGGDWVTFRDGPHFQLPWDKYPTVDKLPAQD